jgi:hypothetical protein
VIITVSLRGIGHGVGRRRTEVYAVSLGDEGSSGHLGARSLCVVLDSRCSSCVSFLNAPGRSWAAPRCALRLARGARSAAVLPSSRLTSARPRSVPPLFVSFAGAHQLRWCTSQADGRVVAYRADEVTRDLAARHSSFSLAAPARRLAELTESVPYAARLQEAASWMGHSVASRWSVSWRSGLG